MVYGEKMKKVIRTDTYISNLEPIEFEIGSDSLYEDSEILRKCSGVNKMKDSATRKEALNRTKERQKLREGQLGKTPVQERIARQIVLTDLEVQAKKETSRKRFYGQLFKISPRGQVKIIDRNLLFKRSIPAVMKVKDSFEREVIRETIADIISIIETLNKESLVKSSELDVTLSEGHGMLWKARLWCRGVAQTLIGWLSKI